MMPLRLSPRARGVMRRTLRRVEQLTGADSSRFVIDEAVLRGTLAIRAAAARHRATLDPAVERERAFASASESYRSTVEDAARVDAHMRRIAIDGLPWWVPLLAPDDEIAVGRTLAQQDFPYRAIAQTREVALGGIMLDIGGNTGRMSIPRVLMGDMEAAYCAEPEPLNYACLVRNVRDNGVGGLVLPDRVAIGSEDRTLRMMRGKTSGGHRVINDGVTVKRETLDVPALTLDTWCDRLGVDLRRIVFVKVDTQGSELHVLRGASRLLAHRHVAWQIEIDVALLQRRAVAVDDLFALIQRHFTHFIDLGGSARGPRVRPVEGLPGALAHLRKGAGSRTDVLAFTMQAPGEPAR